MTNENQTNGSVAGTGATVTSAAASSSRSTPAHAMAPAEKPEKFSGIAFKHWQTKMLFYLTTLSLQRFIKEDPPVMAENTPDDERLVVPSRIVDLERSRIIFAKAFPYLGFAYAVINRVLIQAMSEDRIIHIVELGSGDTKLWIPFLKNVVNLPNGTPNLKITCVNNNKAMLEEMASRIKKEAKALDISFQFNSLNVNLRELTLDMLKVKAGESLAFVSILNLHVLLAEDDRINSQFALNKNNNNNNVKDCKRMSKFLTMLNSLSPKVLILVEQEADHNLSKLVDRFVEGLHYYSALFDSIDTTFKGSNYLLCEERVAVEQMLGKEIENMVACEGLEREVRHERFG
ncbi:della protein rgl1 [Nicotiana attenuata]|uniref:Della protein rgl1 n=1 Tax=Nicotiana attenuata TaxID=49451 RepID=A0A1J6KNH3_NICAT|nr:della protein rgl1 [Nicotiana attenuata]